MYHQIHTAMGLWYCRDPSGRRGDPEVDTYTYDHMMSDKGADKLSGEGRSSRGMVLEQVDSKMEKSNF